MKVFKEERPQPKKYEVDKEKALQFYDDAKQYLKVAQNFSYQYFNQGIPKNAIHGRISKNVYIYVTDYKQFWTPRTRLNVFLLDCRSDDGLFHKTLIKKHSRLYNDILAMIVYHDLKDVVCIYPRKTKQLERPELRTTGEYIHRANPRQLLDSRAADYGRGITDTSVTAGIYIPHDPHGNKDIQKRQKDYYNHYSEYQIALAKARQTK